MSIKSSHGVIFVAIYSIFLANIHAIYMAMFLPILLELFRNKRDLWQIFKKLFALNIFVLMVSVTLYFSDKHLAYLIFVRSNMIMLFTLLIFHKKDYFNVASSLKELRFPSTFVTLFYFSGKFIYLLHADIQKFNNRLKVRGFRYKTSLFTYKTYANFVGLFFVNSLKRAQMLNNVLLLRGFQGEIYSLEQRDKKIDFYEIVLLICFFICIFYKGGYLL